MTMLVIISATPASRKARAPGRLRLPGTRSSKSILVTRTARSPTLMTSRSHRIQAVRGREGAASGSAIPVHYGPVARRLRAPGGDGMRIETDDGVSLAVEVAGAGPPFLLVHGFGGAKED